MVDAIRRGRVQLVTRPLRFVDVLRFVVGSGSTLQAVRDGLQYLGRVLRRTGHAPARVDLPPLGTLCPQSEDLGVHGREFRVEG